VNGFFGALQFLTCCPWPRNRERLPEELGRSAMFFPVIGLLLGLILGFVDWMVRAFAGPTISSVLLVAVMAIATRALHLDGLSDTVDGLGAGGGREHILDVMDDSHIGVFGTVAIVLVLLLKIRALEHLDGNRGRALILASVLSRWAMVLIVYRANAARQGLGSLMIAHMKGWHFFAATAIALAVAAAIAQLFGLSVMIAVAVLTVIIRSYFQRRLGGITGDICGAVGELSETSALLLAAYR
jgi:adenosylcobinamide-GDP ribazoletransferase